MVLAVLTIIFICNNSSNNRLSGWCPPRSQLTAVVTTITTTTTGNLLLTGLVVVDTRTNRLPRKNFDQHPSAQVVKMLNLKRANPSAKKVSPFHFFSFLIHKFLEYSSLPPDYSKFPFNQSINQLIITLSNRLFVCAKRCDAPIKTHRWIGWSFELASQRRCPASA